MFPKSWLTNEHGDGIRLYFAKTLNAKKYYCHSFNIYVG